MSTVFENRITRQVAILAIFLIGLCLLPAILGVALFLIALRALLTLYKNVFHPQYGDLLGGMNNYFSGDSPYHDPLSIVSGYTVLEGHLDLDQLKTVVSTKLREFEVKRPRPWFPELKMSVTSWMGFSIFEKDVNFHIDHHIKFLGDLEINQEDTFRDLEVNDENLVDVCFQLSRVPFQEGRSPWEFLVHHNVNLGSRSPDDVKGHRSKKTILFLRHHHTLCDALALLKLLGHFFDSPQSYERFMSKFTKTVDEKGEKSNFEKVRQLLALPIFGLYESAKLLVDSWDSNEWHRGWPKLRKNFRYVTFDPIPAIRIKNIRRVQGGAKFFNVVLTALTGALRRFTEKQGVEVPKAVHAVVSIPIPKASHRLNNNITCIPIEIPTGLESRRDVLQRLEDQSLAGKKSRFPLIALALTSFLGLFPQKLLANYWIFTTLATSNFPGFDDQIKICGLPCLNVNALATMPGATTGIYFWCSGYMGKLFLTLGMSDHIASSREQVKDLQLFIEEELAALENLDGVQNIPSSSSSSSSKLPGSKSSYRKKAE